jgi:thiol:disulfide interchange protein DsbD
MLLLAVLNMPSAQAASEDELLEPEKAFALSVRARDAQTLEATWTIANGYYMYREKFKFESLDPAVQLKPAQIPPGIRKRDEFFGEVETYRNTVKVVLPVTRGHNGSQTVKLRITSQGCADIGVCYPPHTREFNVTLPAAASVAKPGVVTSLSELSRLIDGTGKSQKFLPVDEAFKIHVERRDDHSLNARLHVAKGYYLYRDKTGFALTQGDGVTLGRYQLPAGEIKDDPYIGKTAVYHDPVEVVLPLTRTGNSATPIAVKVDYQGCADKGICYPPSTKLINLVLPAAMAAVPGGTPGMNAPGITDGTPQTTVRMPISAEKWVLVLLAAFGTGLLLTFTPCVLPMIPILSSVIVGSSDRHVTKLEGGLLSSAYVLGTAVTYTIAGVIAGASGDQLQAYFQHPAAIITFSGVLVFLALSMFGFYELQLPAFLQSKLHEHSADIHLKTKHTKVGALFGVFGMGLIAALIVGACVSPLLISALGVAIANRDPLLGGGIMFSMALGMGVILIAIGVGAGFLIPKAGAWMEKVKHVFGVMLLAVAIYLLGVLPEVPVLLLWAALFIVTSVYLGATQGLPAGAGGWRYLWKGIGTLLLIWGVLALIGGFSGERDILKPLPQAGIAALSGPTAQTPAGEAHFARVTTLAALSAKLAEARARNTPVMLDYYATWCTDCVRMEKTTFTDPRVRAALARFVLIQADVTDNNADAIAIKQAHEVFGPPATLFFSPDGREIRALRFYGYRNADDFLAMLAKL